MAEQFKHQLQNWVCCTKCGDVTARSAALGQGWLVAPYKFDTDVEMVRCYRHITLWSLKASFAGVTQHWLRKMEDGKIRAQIEAMAGVVPRPFAAPYPLEDWDAKEVQERSHAAIARTVRRARRRERRGDSTDGGGSV